jgi:glycosyltransferase involved in cell wall biosynthesis
MNQKHICHLTSAHHRNDVRIFNKEIKSLKKTGCKLSLIVADGFGEDTIDNIHIIDIGKPSGRKERWLKTRKIVYKKAIELDADFYHFHDPELLSAGKKLAKRGKTIIYDIHEDTPRQMLDKPYLPRTIAKIISVVFERFENKTVKHFSALICATPFIRDRFLKFHPNVEVVNNFPLIEEYDDNGGTFIKDHSICYIGNVAQVRGIESMVKMMDYLDDNIRLNMAGLVCGSDADLLENLKKTNGWKKVIYHGLVNRKEIYKLMNKSKIGLVLFHPIPNHLDALPTKMFEYMIAGIPIVVSDFPFWKGIVEENHCGLTADPLNPQEVAEKIQYLLDKPEIAREMGANGRKAVLEKYNWGIEEKKLIDIYNSLLK